MLLAMRTGLIGATMILAIPVALADQTSGKADFITLCAPCHGNSGKGDGANAAALHKKPADLTEIAKRNGGVFPQEQMFETISGLDAMDAHGTRDMPVWGDIFVNQAVGNSITLEDAMKASDLATQRIIGLLRHIEFIQEKP